MVLCVGALFTAVAGAYNGGQVPEWVAVWTWVGFSSLTLHLSFFIVRRIASTRPAPVAPPAHQARQPTTPEGK